jgi:3-oxoacyl-[acyl-carrier protein] reductase
MESDMNKLEGKVAVVTGASHGIGRAIAERLARDGAAVVINYASREADAASIVSEIEAAGGKALAVQADVTKRDDIARLFAEADRAYGRLDILVNNAGVGAMGPLDEIDEATWDRVFALNAKAPLFVTQEAARRMGEGGRIVNVSSTTTYFPLPGTSVTPRPRPCPASTPRSWRRNSAPRGSP